MCDVTNKYEWEMKIVLSSSREQSELFMQLINYSET